MSIRQSSADTLVAKKNGFRCFAENLLVEYNGYDFK
jgi:hypothetical protein